MTPVGDGITFQDTTAETTRIAAAMLEVVCTAVANADWTCLITTGSVTVSAVTASGACVASASVPDGGGAVPAVAAGPEGHSGVALLFCAAS